MTPTSPDVKSIFGRALEIESLKERAAYLDAACGADPGLRGEVENLLASFGRAGEFLRRPAAAGLADLNEPLAEGPGSRVGPYKLLQQIGEGGMGAVFMAEQEDPVRRTVALKVIKPGMDSRQVVARFMAERQALALMDHPNIAKVFDAGTTDGGRPYFVMELVKGIPMNQFCDEQRLTPKERLGLFVPVCQAVQHAHQKGVIHRDLKPSNVLVALYDDRPVPKVIDFGIAKATGKRLIEQTLFTEFGSVLGTLEYMSPEQAKLNALDVDTRSDVYSLGVMLYELLSGSTPLQRQRLKQAALDELLRIIREEEPEKPSTRLSHSGQALATISASRRTEAAQLGQVLRGELDWIVMKALEKDRARRYGTANDLARDLERYLHDEPVEACPPRPGYRLRKALRKHKAAVLTAAAFAALLALGAAVSVWQAVRATLAEGEARRQGEAARAAGEKARAERDQARRALYVSDMNTSKYLLDAGAVTQARERLLRHAPQPGEPDLRGFEWWHLHRVSGEHVRTLEAQGGAVLGVAFSPDGSRLVSVGRPVYGGKAFDLYVWDARSGRRLLTLPGHTAPVHGVAYSPDGKYLASASGDKTVRLWDAGTGRELRRLGRHDNAVYAVAFHPRRPWLVTGGHDSLARLWDLSTGEEMRQFQHGKAVPAVAFSPDGARLATGCGDHTVQLWDAETGNHLAAFPGHTDVVRALTFTPDGAQVVSAGWDGRILVWDLQTGKSRLAGQHLGRAETVAVSPDGQHVASSGWSQSVAVRGVDAAATTQPARALREHVSVVHTVAFSPDGRTIASGSDDGTVKLWDWQGDTQHSRTIPAQAGQRHKAHVVALAVSPDGRWLATATGDRTARLWVARTGDRVHTWETGRDAPLFQGVAFSPDNAKVAVTCAAGAVQIRDVADGALLHELKGPATSAVNAVAFHPRDVTQLAVSYDGIVKLWDLTTGKELRTLRGDEGPIRELAFHPDGSRLVGTSSLRGPFVWDTQTGQVLHVLQGHTAGLFSAVFSPDGAWIATGAADREVRLWDAATGQPLRTLKGHTGRVFQVAFSPDGKRLASASADFRVKLWNPATGEELLTLAAPGEGGHAMPISVAFSPNGRQLLAGCSDGTVRVWEASAEN